MGLHGTIVALNSIELLYYIGFIVTFFSFVCATTKSTVINLKERKKRLHLRIINTQYHCGLNLFAASCLLLKFMYGKISKL